MGWMPAAGTDLGDRLRRHLEQDRVAWLTSVGADGTPQPNPVWFIVEGEEILVWNAARAHRLNHIRSRPRVALNFNSTRTGGDILIITGEAHLDESAPLPHEVPAYGPFQKDHAASLTHRERGPNVRAEIQLLDRDRVGHVGVEQFADPRMDFGKPPLGR